MGNVYSLIASVGIYDDNSVPSLPMYKNDMLCFSDALIKGLFVDKDNIRILGDEGYVSLRTLGLAMAGFSKFITAEDTFFFYFSGHGTNGELLFSDKMLNVQGLIKYINEFPSKNKIVILDCCHSGDYELISEEEVYLDDLYQNHIGEGTVIIASSSAVEVSRASNLFNGSVFTNILSASIKSNRLVKENKKSINDIINDTRLLMDKWNERFPENAQNPVVRDYVVGSVFFDIPNKPYVFEKIMYETDDYYLLSVKPLSTNQIKRIAAFIIPKSLNNPDDLGDITKDVVKNIKNKRVYASKVQEDIFADSDAEAIWCYFGKDESDILKANHYAYTIYAKDEYREKYYRQNSNMKVIDDICIYVNNSYDMIRKMNETAITKDEYLKMTNELLDSILRQAERFISQINEYKNDGSGFGDIYEINKNWIRDINQKYLRLSSFDSAPDEIYTWFEDVLAVAGDIVDLSLLINKSLYKDMDIWLIDAKISDYHRDLEKIR